jgi:hypothetical protein
VEYREYYTLVWADVEWWGVLHALSMMRYLTKAFLTGMTVFIPIYVWFYHLLMPFRVPPAEKVEAVLLFLVSLFLRLEIGLVTCLHK